MLHNFSILLFLGTCTIASAKLEAVQVVWRHGDRYPEKTYPNDPYINESIFDPKNIGQLTNVGKRQHFELGRFLRNRYDGFLEKTYNPSEIHVTATDIDRTVMSALCDMAGLYEVEPRALKTNWNTSIQWTPFPVRSVPRQLDDFLLVLKPCPKLEKEMKYIFKGSPAHDLINEHKDLFDYLVRMTGESKEEMTLEKSAVIWDILIVESIHGYELPAWTNQIMDDLTGLVGRQMQFYALTDVAKRLRSGPLWKKWLTAMESKKGPKMNIYSAHADTVVGLMELLGIFEPIPVPYATGFIAELHSSADNTMPFVEFYLRNDSTREPYQMNVPGCGDPCYLHKLVSITKQFTPTDWDNECKLEANAEKLEFL